MISLVKLKSTLTEEMVEWEVTVSYVTTLEGERRGKPAYAHYFRWHMTLMTDARTDIELTQKHPNVRLGNALSVVVEDGFQGRFGTRVMTPWFKMTSTRCMWQTTNITESADWTTTNDAILSKLKSIKRVDLNVRQDYDSYPIILRMKGTTNKVVTRVLYKEWSTPPD